MDPDLGVGLRDTRSAIHGPPSHPRHPSRLDDHDPSTASVSYSTTAGTNQAAAAAAAAAASSSSSSSAAAAAAAPSTAPSANADDNGPQSLAHHAAPALESAESAHSFRDSSVNCDPESLPMTTSSVPLPTLRSNGQGTPPARRIQSPAGRIPSRQSLRSVSNPLEFRSTLNTPSLPPSHSQPGHRAPVGQPGQPSVKDLKKRFDQNSNPNQGYLQNQSGTARPSIPRSPSARHHHAPTPLRQDPSKLKPQATPAAYTSPRAGVASLSSRETQTSSSSPQPRSQRPKYVAQDQLSNSSQSFASRVANPRSATNGTSRNSRSMTHLSRKPLPETSILPRPFSPNPPRNPPGRFSGELPSPDHDLTSGSSFAIDSDRPRRTSDSSVHGLLARQRSFTDSNAETSSTTDWLPGGPLSGQRKSPKPTPRISLSSTPNLSAPASRIPVSVRRLNSPTTSSPSSTRSNSPSVRRRSQINTKAPGAAPTTPGAKTPVGRKGVPPSLEASANSSRLQAYIGERPSQLSPPLRSSRPRQPISMASTANSSLKGSGKGGSPNRLKMQDSLAAPHHGLGHRRVSVGLIDFEQRREHIRLAYSKSIRESQVYEESQKALMDRRRREMEAHSRAIAAAIGEDVSPTSKHGPHMSLPNSDFEEDDSADELDHDLSGEPATRSTLKLLTETPPGAASRPHPASSSASMSIPSGQFHGHSFEESDSPVLCMPGSFPDADSPVHLTDRPFSMISTVTEFDIEPQIEPPLPANASASIPISFAQPRAVPHAPSSTQAQQPNQGYSFGEEMLSPRQLPASRAPGQIASLAATRSPPFDASAPFPRLDLKDDSDCDSDFESLPAEGPNGDHDDDDYGRDCVEDGDDRRREERRPANHFGLHATSGAASTCASSEIETFDELLYPSSFDQPSSFEPSSRLTVPSLASRAERLSRESIWTDFSMDSMNPSDATNSPTMQLAPYPFNHPSRFEAQSDATELSSQNGASSTAMADKPDVRPTVAEKSQQPAGPIRQHKLPALDTKHGFAVPYLSSNASQSISYPPSPTHEPPPIPTSGPSSVLNSRTSSVLYEQSQYGSTLMHSERESGEFPTNTETPHSLDTTSIETGDQLFETKPQADGDAKSQTQDSEEIDGKERRRLIQRRNVIKELVDTEAIFVRDMNIVEEIYKGTAEACPKLDSKTIKLIFRNSDEIIEFHTSFLTGLKDAVAEIYTLKARTMPREDPDYSEASQNPPSDLSDAKDRTVSLGPVFQANMEKMKRAHEGFLRNSDQAAKRLIQIQQDSTVNVWLNECNEVAKDLTAAWDLDSLLIKPMQRITKYPNLIMTLLQHTPQDHPDREALIAAKDVLEEAIIEINKTKKNFELVGQIVGRKRKESDVKAGIARAFGKRVDKLQASGNRPPEDPEYARLEEKFSDDYLRLQVVLRDVEFYSRQVSAYVHEFLQYLSAIELIMRLQPGNYPELESKWVQFNISIRDLEKVALEQHLTQVRKLVIEPFEQVIKAYGNPSLAMKKRAKRRMVWERSEQLKRAGKTVDPKLKELVEQYEALNETLIKELPKLSALTEKVGNICLGNLINIQTSWYGIWKDKMKTVLGDAMEMPDIDEIVATFQRDFPYANEHLASISIINPTYWPRTSQSAASVEDGLLKARTRPAELEFRERCHSINAETAPVLPAPDFGKRHSGSFTLSSNAVPAGGAPSPRQFNFREYYTNYQPSLVSPKSVEVSGSSRSYIGTGQTSTRPSTGRSFDSGAVPRRSTESAPQTRRDSSVTFHSMYQAQDSGRFSNMFHSALPLPDGPEESQRSSRASSRERSQNADGYNVLWLAASLFEFNIATTKHEAGYPYLTYQAGEIFDVIAEKGELWLAKNQDDPTEQVGWIWSKHFAPLADS